MAISPNNIATMIESPPTATLSTPPVNSAGPFGVGKTPPAPVTPPPGTLVGTKVLGNRVGNVTSVKGQTVVVVITSVVVSPIEQLVTVGGQEVIVYTVVFVIVEVVEPWGLCAGIQIEVGLAPGQNVVVIAIVSVVT